MRATCAGARVAAHREDFLYGIEALQFPTHNGSHIALPPHFLPVSCSFLPHRTRIHSMFPIKGLVHFASAVRCDFAPRMRATRSRTFQNFSRPKRSSLKLRDYTRFDAGKGLLHKFERVLHNLRGNLGLRYLRS